MIGEFITLLKDWQQAYTLIILMFFLQGYFKTIANAIRFHRHHENGKPIDSNGNEIFPGGKIN